MFRILYINYTHSLSMTFRNCAVGDKSFFKVFHACMGGFLSRRGDVTWLSLNPMSFVTAFRTGYCVFLLARCRIPMVFNDRKVITSLWATAT